MLIVFGCKMDHSDYGKCDLAACECLTNALIQAKLTASSSNARGLHGTFLPVLCQLPACLCRLWNPAVYSKTKSGYWTWEDPQWLRPLCQSPLCSAHRLCVMDGSRMKRRNRACCLTKTLQTKHAANENRALTALPCQRRPSWEQGWNIFGQHREWQ